MKKLLLTFFVLLAYQAGVVVRTAAAAQDPGAPTENTLYRLIPDPGVYLGWMPMAYVNAGEKFTLDLSRYMDADETTKITLAGESENFPAPTVTQGRFLELDIPEGRTGLFDIPLNVRTPDFSGKVYLTLVVSQRISRQFTYRPDKPVKKVAVAGSFNNWNDSAELMRDADNDGVWETAITLDPGIHSYKLVVDGEWVPDPGNPDLSADQYRNSLLTIERPQAKPRPYLIPEKMTRREAVFRVVASAPLLKISALIQEPAGSNRKAEFELKGDLLTVRAPGRSEGSYLRLAVMDSAGETSAALRIPLGKKDRFRWHDAVIYFAMLDRFVNADPSNDAPTNDPDINYLNEYHGGDLAGLLKKIEDGYFNGLGVNTLWLSPLYKNPDKAFKEYAVPYRYFSGYHGYWPVDFNKVDSRLGDIKLVKKVVDAAHRKGLRVLFDMVFNHAHTDHPYWKEHPEWFVPLGLPDGRENLRLWNEYPFSTWFDRFIPTFDLDRPELIEKLLENAKWWLDETGADGFRLDAVKHVRHQFWCNLRKYLRKNVEAGRGERLYMVGETFLSRQGIMEFVGPNKLDGQFDFPLYDAIIPVFAGNTAGFGELDAALEAGERVYGKETVPSTLVGNQDKARFMAFADGDLPDEKFPDDREIGYVKPPKVDNDASYAKLKNAMTFIFTIDGAPLIYYGDEFGQTGAGDPDNRRDMRFGDQLSGQEKDMLAYSARLGLIRAAHPSLRYGSRRTVLLEADLYAYTRAYFGDRVLVLFNKSDKPRTVKIKVSPDLPPGRYADLLSDQKIPVDPSGYLETTVPAMTSMIFAAEN